MFTKQQIDEMNRTLQGLENYAQKAVDDNVSIEHTEHPASPGGRSMSVRVRHGASKTERDAAVAKAHSIAKEHGHDPKTARISSYGNGDQHCTTCSYNAMQNSGGYGGM